MNNRTPATGELAAAGVPPTRQWMFADTFGSLCRFLKADCTLTYNAAEAEVFSSREAAERRLAEMLSNQSVGHVDMVLLDPDLVDQFGVVTVKLHVSQVQRCRVQD